MAKALKVGMHVRVSKTYIDGLGHATDLAGRTGIVRRIIRPTSIGVMFSKWHNGHSLMGAFHNSQSDSGWYIHAESLTPVDVKRNGKTYRVVRKGKKSSK